MATVEVSHRERISAGMETCPALVILWRHTLRRKIRNMPTPSQDVQ
jgi:hypothetical protein